MSAPSSSDPTNLPRRILVVDDDEHTRALLRDLCEGAGYRVSVAMDGDEALAAIARQPPDLVLLDLMMPKRDGFSVLQALREAPATAELPVVLLTANADIDGKIRGMELGATDYVTKPFKLIELQTRIRSALTLQEYRRRLSVMDEGATTFHATDPLTGAGTYAQLKVSLDAEVGRVKRYGLSASLLLLGIHDFASFRYHLAHAGIEALLADVAAVIRTRMRGADRLFRLDNDEFVLLLPQTALPGATVAAERIAEAASTLRPVDAGPSGPPVQLRIAGAALEGKASPTAEGVLRTAYSAFKDLELRGKFVFGPGEK